MREAAAHKRQQTKRDAAIRNSVQSEIVSCEIVESNSLTKTFQDVALTFWVDGRRFSVARQNKDVANRLCVFSSFLSANFCTYSPTELRRM